VLGLGGAGIAHADPWAACVLRPVGDRAFAEVELDDMLDDDRLRLIRLGLRAKVHAKIALLRHRWWWLDERADAVYVDFDLVYDPASDSLVRDDTGDTIDPERIAVGRVTLQVDDESDLSDYYVEVDATLTVVTRSTLGDVAKWITDPSRGRAVFSDQLLGVIADDLVNSASTTCAMTQGD
jgi:hypothetical protein